MRGLARDGDAPSEPGPRPLDAVPTRAERRPRQLLDRSETRAIHEPRDEAPAQRVGPKRLLKAVARLLAQELGRPRSVAPAGSRLVLLARHPESYDRFLRDAQAALRRHFQAAALDPDGVLRTADEGDSGAGPETGSEPADESPSFDDESTLIDDGTPAKGVDAALAPVVDPLPGAVASALEGRAEGTSAPRPVTAETAAIRMGERHTRELEGEPGGEAAPGARGATDTAGSPVTPRGSSTPTGAASMGAEPPTREVAVDAAVRAAIAEQVCMAEPPEGAPRDASPGEGSPEEGSPEARFDGPPPSSARLGAAARVARRYGDWCRDPTRLRPPERVLFAERTCQVLAIAVLLLAAAMLF